MGAAQAQEVAPAPEERVVQKRPELPKEADFSALGRGKFDDLKTPVVQVPEKELLAREALAKKVNEFVPTFPPEARRWSPEQRRNWAAQKQLEVLQRELTASPDEAHKRAANGVGIILRSLQTGAPVEDWAPLQYRVAMDSGILVDPFFVPQGGGFDMSRLATPIEATLSLKKGNNQFPVFIVSDPKEWWGLTSPVFSLPTVNRRTATEGYSIEGATGAQSLTALAANELAHSYLQLNKGFYSSDPLPEALFKLPAGPKWLDKPSQEKLASIEVRHGQHWHELFSDGWSSAVVPNELARITEVSMVHAAILDQVHPKGDTTPSLYEGGYALIARVVTAGLHSYDRQNKNALELEKELTALRSSPEGKALTARMQELRVLQLHDEHQLYRQEQLDLLGAQDGQTKAEVEAADIRIQKHRDKTYELIAALPNGEAILRNLRTNEEYRGGVFAAVAEAERAFAPKSIAASARIANRLGEDGRRQMATLLKHYADHLDSFLSR